MTDEEKIISGIEAKQILASPIVQAAFRAIEHAAIEDLVNSTVTDDLKRCRLVERIRAIRDVRDAIDSIRVSGKTAAERAGAAFD